MLHVVWIFVDGVRRYHSEDDRGRLDVMDEFAARGVEFVNTVTSAPSTFQSLSAMASGMHSYYLNRNFQDFIFDDSAFPSIRRSLVNAGYADYSVLMHPVTRETLQKVFPMIGRRFWPKGVSHETWWSNRQVLEAVTNVLRAGPGDPAFFFVNFNCRNDPEISAVVQETLERFREGGLTDANTLTILCSDHGYPDPARGMGPEFHRRHRLGHDAILTDDNIMIPLMLQFPGGPQGMRVETTVSSIDVFPTILDLLGLPVPDGVMGKSLLPLIRGEDDYRHMMEERFHRCDSRLSCQVGRGTVIRNGDYKYVYYHDEARGRREEFFDIRRDALEENDLVNSESSDVQAALDVFRKAFRRSEEAAQSAQLEYLFKKLMRTYGERVARAKSLLLTDTCSPNFLAMLVSILRRANPDAELRVLFVEHPPIDFNGRAVAVDARAPEGWAALTRRRVRRLLGETSVDLLLVPFNTSEARDIGAMVSAVKSVRCMNRVFLDYNMRCFTRTISYEWRLFLSAWPFVKYEPMLCAKRFLAFLGKAILRISVVDRPRRWVERWLGLQPDWKAFQEKRYKPQG